MLKYFINLINANAIICLDVILLDGNLYFLFNTIKFVVEFICVPYKYFIAQ